MIGRLQYFGDDSLNYGSIVRTFEFCRTHVQIEQ